MAEQNLLQFLGYGTLDAPIWFLGMEEAFTGKPGFTHADNLRVRSSFTEVMDVQDAHRQLQAEYWKAKRLKTSAVWQWMAKLTLALVHFDNEWSNTAKVHDYIRSCLGRDQTRGGETFLIELLPLPKRSANDWPDEYHSLFPTRTAYERQLRPQRIEQLGTLISTHQPRFVFCYGQANYSYYRELVGDNDWLEAPLSGTRFWIKKLGESYVVLTPFFGNGQISTEAVKLLIQYLRTMA